MSSNGSAPSFVEDVRGGLQRVIADAVAAEAQRHACDGLSKEILAALARSIVRFERKLVAEALTPPVKRIIELEARLLALEQLPSMKYQGTYNAERTYFVGD